MSTRQTLEQVAKLAEARRVVRIGYRRPGEAGPNEFEIEPYRVQRTASGSAGLHAWQLSPMPEGRADGWRDFRLDRVTSVADAGRAFEPRQAVTLSQELAAASASVAAARGTPGPGVTGPAPTAFHAWADRPIASVGPAEDYFNQLETAMLDGKITPEEVSLARSLGERVEAHERKAAHARVFANVLHEVIQDSRISHREELYLKAVRQFLEQLGWAP